MEFKRIATPLGTMVLAADDRGLVGVWFVGQEHFAGPGPDWREVASSPVLDAAAAQLARRARSAPTVGFTPIEAKPSRPALAAIAPRTILAGPTSAPTSH